MEHLMICLDKHYQCVRSTPFIPTRLLNIVADSSGLNVRLHSPKLEANSKSSDISLPYVALSHCWGKHQPIRTMRANLVSFQDYIPWNDLAKTFQDAIQVTFGLGLTYIWIDSLCIVQDDVEDWARESAQMAAIFSNALLTIAASGATNGSEGLFFDLPSPQREFDHPPRRPEGSIFFQKFLWQPSLHQLEETQKREVPERKAGSRRLDRRELPLVTRGWTFQELFLSSRIVHFTRGELAWQCIEQDDCQCKLAMGARWLSTDNYTRREFAKNFMAPSPVDMKPPTKAVKDGTVWFWHETVQAYSKLKLTFDEDSLPALSAISRMLSKRLGNYYAGVFEHGLPHDLLWYCLSLPAESRRANPPKPGLDLASSPPSWSWASVRDLGILQFGKVSNAILEILDISTYLSTADPGGIVSGGHLTVKGRLTPVQVFRYKDSEPTVFRFKDGDLSSLPTHCALDIHFQNSELDEGDFFHLLFESYQVLDHKPPYFVYTGIILRPLQDADMTGMENRSPFKAVPVYQRVGHGDLFIASKRVQPQDPAQIITIL